MALHQKFQHILPRQKAKDLPCNNVKDFFKTSFQYNAVLPMTAAVQGTDSESFYQKLGLGSLQKRYKL